MQLLLVCIYKLKKLLHDKFLHDKFSNGKSTGYKLCGPCKDSSEDHSLLEKANSKKDENSIPKYDATQN